MKFLLLSIPFFIALLFSGAYAQNIQDAYQFSNAPIKGTARYNSMAGAFGALGGDISAMKDNPAGSSVFLTNFGSVSLASNFYNNQVSLNGFTSKTSDDQLDISQIGAVFVFNNYDENATLTKFAFGVTYDSNKTFNNEYNWQGYTPSSISNYFVNLANGVPVNYLEPLDVDNTYRSLGELNIAAGGISNTDLQTAYIGYQAFLMDPLSLENNTYTSNVLGNEFDQHYNYISEGNNGKVSANGSFNLNNKLYLGLNLNGHFINKEISTSFLEQTNTSSTTINEVYFENYILTLGGGFSFDLGAIYRLNENIRLGGSYNSPTWYSIHDETNQYIDSNSPEDGFIYIEPNITNILPNYNYQTPSKYNASFAYLFGTSGLISIDYSYKDFSKIEYSAKGNYYDFNTLNQQIETNFKSVSSIKIGGEYRYKHWSFRGGFNYNESPYKNEKIISDSKLYSGGIGYNFGNYKLDLSYSRFNQTYQQSFYRTGLSPAEIEYISNNVTLTVSANL
ncbi:OmpP1/FadL family transporter [Mesonia aestuariivivens]|uniref:Outer membrane protein transport protein n=1 Tax=Mesonia aestuariivivens TaxID=2796128 RepID=A0ABS6W0I5_9FLAO|nr:outer membrane protein transport protein [Mesonia aestuariivivens]MBW2961067.1 outer membrane protein transport protein [Mesonia aestuariivivens]